jgi:type II secretory pathway component PulF
MYFFTILSYLRSCSALFLLLMHMLLGLPLVTSLLCHVNLSRLCHQWSSFQMASHVRYANITLSKKSKLKNQAFLYWETQGFK